MKLFRFCALFLTLGGLFAAAADAAPKNCQLTLVMSLDVAFDNGGLLANAKINGRDIRLLVDTGGYSTIKKSIADELKLKKFGTGYTEFTDSSGKTIRDEIEIQSFSIGGFEFKNRVFLAAIDPALAGGKIDGTIGADFLINFDIEVDFLHRKVNLFSKDHCKDPGPYWTTDYASIPMSIIDQHILFPTTINGKKVATLLDTGTSLSALAGEVDCRLSEKAPGRKYPELRKFDEINIEDISIRNTDILVETKYCIDSFWPNIRSYDGRPEYHPFTIGINQLQSMRIYIDYADKILYLSGAEAK